MYEEDRHLIPCMPRPDQTAQVASQQGKYLGEKFNFLAKPSTKEAMLKNQIFIDDDAVHCEPFQYNHLGSLAYIGNAGK